MEGVAAEAGVTRAVVYTHYASREELVLAGVRRARAELHEEMNSLTSSIDAGLSTRDIIDRGGRIFFGMLARDRARWQLLFTPQLSFSAETRRELETLRAQTVANIAVLGRRLQADIAEDRVSAFAYAISGVGEQIGRWWLTHPAATLDEVVDLYADFIVHGIGSQRLG